MVKEHWGKKKRYTRVYQAEHCPGVRMPQTGIPGVSVLPHGCFPSCWERCLPEALEEVAERCGVWAGWGLDASCGRIPWDCGHPRRPLCRRGAARPAGQRGRRLPASDSSGVFLQCISARFLLAFPEIDTHWLTSKSWISIFFKMSIWFSPIWNVFHSHLCGYHDIFNVIDNSLNPKSFVVHTGRKSPRPLVMLLKRASRLQA